MAKSDFAPPGVILLSAGRGSRMLPLTEGIPKSLLPVGDRLVLDWLIGAITERSDGEIVVVTGYGAQKVREHLSRFGSRVTTVNNERYAEDVNILSVELGVSALKHPERGYLIVETDLLLDACAWDQVFTVVNDPARPSCWVCDGFYNPQLTGGIVHADAQGRIDAVAYQPLYDAAFEGWPKMLGLLLVGSDEVAEDRRLRRAAIEQSIAQYYLMPWREGIAFLPSRVLQLQGGFARSFNTEDDFYRARAEFLARHQNSTQDNHEKVTSA